MQVRKVAVVATGALATAAAMGSTPAFAADSDGTSELAAVTVGVLDYEGKHRASDEEMRELADHWLTVAPEHAKGKGKQAPWEVDPPQILSIASGSAASIAPIQTCGSTTAVAGVALPIASPNTVKGDCNNGNIKIKDDGDGALFSILDNSALSVLPIQTCGSTTAVLGAAVPIASPNTVIGDCNNGNISIGTDKKHGKKK